MFHRHRIGFNISFLLVFLFLTLCINFLHHHNGLQAGDSCPACHFQNSTLSTTQIHFFISPQLALLDTLKTLERSEHDQIVLISPSSRSPPLV
jgi:hypothetical protein